jgi:hypothetical protein
METGHAVEFGEIGLGGIETMETDVCGGTGGAGFIAAGIDAEGLIGFAVAGIIGDEGFEIGFGPGEIAAGVSGEAFLKADFTVGGAGVVGFFGCGRGGDCAGHDCGLGGHLGREGGD